VTLTLIATAGAANANSYADVATADAYFEARPFSSAWTGVTDPEVKKQALIYATSVLDRLRWAGAKGATYASALTQALAWPRRWATTLEADAVPQLVAEYFIDTSLAYYSELVIPRPIVQGTCELALEMLRAGTTGVDPLTSVASRDVKRERVDVLETEYVGTGERVQGLARFPAVVSLVAPLLRGGGAGALLVERV
jgi:hypothetical protein